MERPEAEMPVVKPEAEMPVEKPEVVEAAAAVALATQVEVAVRRCTLHIRHKRGSCI